MKDKRYLVLCEFCGYRTAIGQVVCFPDEESEFWPGYGWFLGDKYICRVCAREKGLVEAKA